MPTANYQEKYLSTLVRLQSLLLLEGDILFVLQKIADMFGELVQPAMVLVFENTSHDIALRFRCKWDKNKQEDMAKSLLPFVTTVAKDWAKALKGGVLVAGNTSDLQYENNLFEKNNFHYFFLLPINTKEQLSYIITLLYTEDNRTSAVETDFFHTIAYHLSAFVTRKKTENQLFSYKRIFQESNLAIFVISKDGYHIETNYNYRKLVGYDTDEELSQISPVVLLASKYVAWFREVRKKGYHEQEFDLRHLGVVVLLSTYAIYDTEGEVVCYVNLAYDITQRIVAEKEMKSLLERYQRMNNELQNSKQELLKREQQLKMLAENSFEMVTLSDSNGKIVYASPSAEKITGYTQAEIYDMNVEMFFEKGNIAEITTQVKAILSNQAKEIRLIHPLKTKSKKLIWLESFIKPITTPETQEIRLQTSSRDITERVLTNKALEESEQKFKNLFNKSYDAILIYQPQKDETCPITEVNEVACKLLGYQKGELLGKNIDEFIADKELIIKHSILQDGQNTFQQTVLYNSYREAVPVEIVFTLLYQQNDMFIQVIIRDITERIRAEESKKAQELAEKLLKIKTEFLANVSHEIRTPMNGILGMAHILAGTSLDEKQRYYVHTVQKSAENLLLILNDILDLSKLEAGKMSLKTTYFNLRQTVEQLKDLFISTLVQKQLSFSIHWDSLVPDYVLADENRLLQVLTNLVSNAVKFTEVGEISIYLKNILYTKDQVILKITVTDTGAGISPKFLNQLFDKFFQVDAQNNKQQGTGLGLAICKQLVGLWGGEIGVESQIGQGSSFWFTLPVEVSQQDTVYSIAEIGSQQYDFQNVTILLVEDIMINQEVAKIMLEQLGCYVAVAHNGEEAVRMAKQKDYDLIFMDIMMPIMDGVEATNHIKKIKLHSIIIGLSANAMEEDAQKYIELGMNDYLAKPIEPQQLGEKLLKWLPHKIKNTPLMQPTILEENLAVTNNLLNLKVIQQLKAFTKNNFNKLQIIIQSFEEDVENLLSNIAQNCAEKNFESVTVALHTLKGLTATIGAMALHEHIKKYYEAAQAHDFSAITVAYSALYPIFTATVEALKKEVSEANKHS
jgi:PAS domain S-box-containing protein